MLLILKPDVLLADAIAFHALAHSKYTMRVSDNMRLTSPLACRLTLYVPS
jgi:hypothetical protein